jgi:uncharacterized iron-regulated membrane protein
MTVQQWMQKFARWHIWVGWAGALPLLMWVITGLVMVARPLGEVRGDALRAKSPSSDAAALVFPKLTGRIEGVELVQQPDGPVWIVTEQGGGRYRYSAKDGAIVPPVIEVEARRIAEAAYAGDARVASVKFIPSDEAPVDLRREVNAWQAAFTDGTRIYIDDSTGEVLALRTKYWRFYDFLYGLHVMDPKGHENAHNPFIVLFAAITLVGASLGSVLLFRRRKARAKA